jgi:hypothetical protein
MVDSGRGAAWLARLLGVLHSAFSPFELILKEFRAKIKS